MHTRPERNEAVPVETTSCGRTYSFDTRRPVLLFKVIGVIIACAVMALVVVFLLAILFIAAGVALALLAYAGWARRRARHAMRAARGK